MRARERSKSVQTGRGRGRARGGLGGGGLGEHELAAAPALRRGEREGVGAGDGGGAERQQGGDEERDEGAEQQPFIARGELTKAEVLDLTRLMTFSTGLRLMEEKVLFDERPLGPDVDRYLEFCADACVHWIRELKRQRELGAAS